MRIPLFLSLTFALAGRCLAKDDDDPDSKVEPGCQPHRWSWDDEPELASLFMEPDVELRAAVEIKPGDVNCRRWDQTTDNVGYWTCNELATKHGLDLDKFWELNPALAPSCEAIKPATEYCVRGFIEPLRAMDGNCGPQNKNATCIGSGHGQCCNAETWKCGETENDCSIGVCYEGLCPGHKVYTTDGNCGYAHGYSLCGGKWGDCCSFSEGKCGTGPEYCGQGKCQSGNCTTSA
ncbi:hypothetical protein RB601_009263 [Gaeumannomyces tritici]